MSDVSIVNRALALIGANKITSLSDETLEAQSANNMYEGSLKSILSECCWGFAKKRAWLNMLTIKPAFGGGNYFQPPSDYVRIFKKTADAEFEGEYLLSYADKLGVIYTFLQKDTNRYTPQFIDAFACRLAYDMSFDLTNSSSKQESLLRLYKGEFLPIARSADARDRMPEKVSDDYWINSVNSARWD